MGRLHHGGVPAGHPTLRALHPTTGRTLSPGEDPGSVMQARCLPDSSSPENITRRWGEHERPWCRLSSLRFLKGAAYAGIIKHALTPMGRLHHGGAPAGHPTLRALHPTTGRTLSPGEDPGPVMQARCLPDSSSPENITRRWGEHERPWRRLSSLRFLQGAAYAGIIKHALTPMGRLHHGGAPAGHPTLRALHPTTGRTLSPGEDPGPMIRTVHLSHYLRLPYSASAKTKRSRGSNSFSVSWALPVSHSPRDVIT
jgi:hypothetical protein